MDFSKHQTSGRERLKERFSAPTPPQKENLNTTTYFKEETVENK